MEEFRSNLLLLLQCRFPQGMMLDKLEEEYEKYFQKHVDPFMFHPESPTTTWRSAIEKTYLSKDLQIFEINNCVYVKPVGIRTEGEMALICKLAKYSHFHYAQDTFFQLRDCSCCNVQYAFPINHYPTGGATQYTTNANLQNPGETTYRTVQYVSAPTATIQGGGAPPGTIQATNLTINGAVSRYEDPLRTQGGGDYYIMLQSAQNIPGAARYDTLGNIITTALEPHRSPDGLGAPQTGRIAYTTAPPQPQPVQQQQPQQWNTVNATTESRPAPPPPKKSKGNKGAGKGSRGGGDSNTGNSKETHHCRVDGCKKTFRRFKLLENHERLAHHKDGDSSLTCSTVGCKERFADKKLLQHHESRCPLKPHRCSWEGCDKTFRTSKLLHGHISAVHRKVGRNTFKCSIPGCNQAYPDSTKLKTHEIRCRFRYETLRDMENNPDGVIDMGAVVDQTVSALVSDSVAATTTIVTTPLSENPGAVAIVSDAVTVPVTVDVKTEPPQTMYLVKEEATCYVPTQL